MKYLFYLSFFALCAVSILDPGNSILGLKEVTFVMTFVLGLFHYGGLKRLSPFVIKVVLIIGFLLPLWGLFLGVTIGNEFKMEVALSYIKSMLFVFLLMVIYRENEQLHKTFAIATLTLIPLIIALWYFVTNNGIEALPLIFDEDTVKISRRSYGPILIDPCIFYKTSPLLIFGLSYVCSLKSKLKFLLVPFILFALFHTGTRANMISGLFVVLLWSWKTIKNNKFLRATFIGAGVIIGLLYVPYLINDVFFSKEEASMEIKASHMTSYMDYWLSNPLNFLLGQGLGSGMVTKVEGLTYLIEPTYLEIIRHWGLLLFPVTFWFLILCPAYHFFYNKKNVISNPYKFYIFAYYAYAFVEIPSNPLLFGSSGMIVLSLAYVVVYHIKEQKKHVLHSSVNV